MRRLVALLSAATLVFAACGDTTSTVATAPADVGAPVAEQVSLADYLPGTGFGPGDADWAEEERRAQEFIATCMAEQGFEYIPWVPAEFEDGGVETWLATEGERRATEGFGMAYDLLFERPEEHYEDQEWDDPNEAISQTLTGAEREAYEIALWGEEPDGSLYEGFDYETATEDEIVGFEEEMERLWRERSWRGCHELGWEEAVGGSQELWTSFDAHFDPWEEIDQRVQADPRTIELEQGWVACMAAAGFTFEDQETMYMSLQKEFDRIVTWPGEEPGEVGSGPETTMAFAGPELEAIEHEDGTVTFVDPEGNVYTEEEAEALWADAEEEWEPTFAEAELQAFFEREVEIAVADWECSEGTYETMAALWEEYQDRWATENKAALDVWKAEFEADQ